MMAPFRAECFVIAYETNSFEDNIMEVVIQDKFGKDVRIGDYVLTPERSNSMGDWGSVTVGKVLDKSGHGVLIEGVSTRVKTSSRITLVSPRFAHLWNTNNLHEV